jgi:GLPGLI family protein
MSFARVKCCLALLALLLMAGRAAAQGLYYETTLVGGPFGKGSEAVTKTFLMPRMMKVMNSQDEDFMIFRLDKEKMISVDTKAKTYWEQTFAELEQAAKAASGRMEKQMAEMQKYLKDLPEEQRKMVEGMSGTSMSKLGDVKVTKSPETKTIGGFACTKFVAKEGEKVLMTIWATRDVKGFEAMRKDYESVTRRMTAVNSTFTKGLVDAMLKIEGFPIRTEWGEMTSTVTKLEQRSTPESAFTVPAGYTKVEPPAGDLPDGKGEPEQEKEEEPEQEGGE